MEFINTEGRALPPKTNANKHRWILIAVHTQNEDDILAGHTGLVGKDTLVGFSVGCADCGLDREEALAAPCLASPQDVATATEAFKP